MLRLDNLAIDIKHINLLATEIQMRVRSLLSVIEVKGHFHEAIVDFTGVEVNVERVLNGLGFNQRVSGLCFEFGEDFGVSRGKG
jgi:hypothetical protein